MNQLDDRIITEELERTIAAARGIHIKEKSKFPAILKCVECREIIPIMHRQITPGCIRCLSCESNNVEVNSIEQTFKQTHDSLDEVIEELYHRLV